MFKRSSQSILSLLLMLCLLLTMVPVALAYEEVLAHEVKAATVVSGHGGTYADNEIEPMSSPTGHRDFSTDSEWDTLRRINAFRIQNGRAPLAMAERMQPLAALRASELDRSFSQTRPNGRPWHTVIDEADISYSLAAEIIARPAMSGQRVLELWLDSERTRTVLLGEFTHIALGHNISTDTWCAHLITSEASHSSLSLLSSSSRQLPFGGRLESLGLIVVARGGLGMSFLPLIDGMARDLNTNRAGAQNPSVSWGGLSFRFSIFVNFADVPSTHRYHSHIRFVTTNRLFTGVSDSAFAPDSRMTRGMFVTVLGRQARQMGLPITGDHSGFVDVRDGAWYTPYIGWAAERGIAQGDRGHFRVTNSVTREQMATFLLRFIHYIDMEPNVNVIPAYADRHRVSDWALEAVDTAVALGLINLRSNNTFAPNELATRAEVARAMAVLVRDHLS